MRVGRSIQLALSTAVLTFALVATAQATSVRTFVASTGNDANTASNCPRTSPCRNFSAAYGVTTTGGEIVALDAAGYGVLSITHAITILGVDGALIAVPASGIGITITASASEFVIIRNLQITGAGAANTTGIKLNTGKLILQSSALRNLTDGLLVDSLGNGNSILRAYLTNSDIIANTRGITTNGTGVNIAGQNPPRSGNVEVLVYGGNVLGNTTAFRLLAAGQDVNQNRYFTIFLGTLASALTVNVQGNATVASGTNPGCPFTCDSVQTYSPSSGTPQDPNP